MLSYEKEGRNVPKLLLFCAALLPAVVSTFRGQSIDYFDDSNARQHVGAGTGTSAVVVASGDGIRQQLHPQQEQQKRGQQPPKSNSNPYDPLLLYGHQQPQHQQHQQQQQQRGRINNGSMLWSAVASDVFGTVVPSDIGNATTRLLAGNGQQQQDGGNVQVQVQLRSYTNAGFRLPDARLCTCPAGNERCLQASPQRNGYNCLTSFAIFVLSADDSIHLEETPYLPLNAAGQLGQQQELGTVFRFQLNTEPSAIAIVVHNLGPQINMDGSLYETNTVTVVDTFVQPLNGAAAAAALPFSPVNRGTAKAPFFPSFVAATVPGQQQNVQLQGRLVGTQLSLTFSVSCRGTLVGPGCDLACNNSAANPSSAICQSRRTGFFSLCRWTSGGGNAAQQVTDCKNCPWGIKESAYCADGQGGVLEPSHAGVVSSSYYTAFVVLCCVCGLLLLCLLVAGLLTCKKIVRMRRDSPASFRRVHQQQAASRGGGGSAVSNAHISTRGDPERALLTSATRPTEDNDTGGFAAFRLGPENGNGAKPPPPPYSVRSNGNAGTDVGGGTHHPQRVAADALTNPFPLPRSNASTASASGRETPSVVAAGGGGGGERQRFPPPLAIGTKTSKTLSPPRFQPLPHLGPQIRQAAAAAAGGVPADSLNSSFAGMSPPSVSADV